MYEDNTMGVIKDDERVAPGYQYVYIWNLIENFENTEDDDACIPWAYHSHVSTPSDLDTGLMGVMTTCKAGQ